MKAKIIFTLDLKDQTMENTTLEDIEELKRYLDSAAGTLEQVMKIAVIAQEGEEILDGCEMYVRSEIEM